MKTKPTFFPVVGGPQDGQEFYPPAKPKKGQPVFLSAAPVTQYEWNEKADAVVFTTRYHLRRKT